MTYGISGNRYKGAHLELSKINKVEEKRSVTVEEQSNSTYFTKASSTEAMGGDSERVLNDNERSVKFRIPTPRSGGAK